MNVRGRDLGSFVDEARAQVDATVPLPAGMTIEWGGEFENQERAMERLDARRAGRAADHAPPALQRVRLVRARGADPRQRAVRAGRRRARALVCGMTLSVSAAVGFIALLGQAS